MLLWVYIIPYSKELVSSRISRYSLQMNETPGLKLQKYIATSGHCSRRAAETLIKAGQVAVNGEPAHLGQRVLPEDKISIDGKIITADLNPSQLHQTILLNKPLLTVCTRSDEEGRETIFEHAPPAPTGQRWIGIGRLDYNTGGVYLFTTDGELAHRCMHPSYGLERFYRVRVNRPLTPDECSALLKGLELEDGHAKFSSLNALPGAGRNRRYEVSLHEGRNRIVRRLFNAKNIDVNKLTRVRFGPIALDSKLMFGQSRPLSPAELQTLYKAVKLPFSKNGE